MIVLQSVKGYKLFQCRSNDAGRRLDRVVKKMLPDVPAGLIYSGIRKGLIKVNGRKSLQSYRIVEDDVIAVSDAVQFSRTDDKKPAAASGKTDLDRLIVLETEDLCFINKPRGMLTHGEDSLAELVKTGLGGIEESLSFTPAPLHRLDRNTTGLIAVSRTITGAVRFTGLLRDGRLKKYYIGLCSGRPDRKLRLENSLGRNALKTGEDEAGKNAVTTLIPLLYKEGFTLCLFEIETGRTHQIRSHASAAGFPLAGDTKYGSRIQGFKGYILHSWILQLPDFDISAGFRTVSAELPGGSYKKLVSIFGKSDVDKALADTRNGIIN